MNECEQPDLSTEQPDLATSEHPAVLKYARHVNPAFVKLLGVLGYGRLFVRARDVWVWDHQERQYLDFLAGFGAINLGHNHPRLVARLQSFLSEEAMNFCHIGPSPHAAELAEALAHRLGEPLSVSLFSNSGAEAVEAGMKLARAATRRTGFLYCQGGFHGTNLGALSIMGEERLRKPFEPLLVDCEAIPFGDLTALMQALATRKFAAFVVEPIQAEAGVVIPTSGYLAEAQQLCRKQGTLLILDEVQTGLGRTGTPFAFQSGDFVPDIVALAKGLSGGIAPIAATITSPEIHARAYGRMAHFDLHSSTFGGNAFSCAAGLETLHILEDENLMANSAARGQQLLTSLRRRLMGHPLVKDVRGHGLLVGIELGPTDSGILNRLSPSLVEMVTRGVFGQWVCVMLLERGILCQPASQRWNVLKLQPPLTIQPEQVEQMVNSVAEVLEDYRGIGPVLWDVTGRLGRQFLAGWRF